MEAFPAAISGRFASIPSRPDGKDFEPKTEVIKQRLIRKGVVPTPKILHTLRKKEVQKYLRRSNRLALREETSPLTESQSKALEEDALFRNAAAEYRAVRAELDGRSDLKRELLGRPWKRPRRTDMVMLGGKSEDSVEMKLQSENLKELRQVFKERNEGVLRCFLDDDDVDRIEDAGENMMTDMKWRNSVERMTDDEKIHLLSRRLSSTNLSIQDWKFSRIMKHSGLLFSEMCMLEIIEELGALRNWRQALSVMKWVYNQQEYKNCKSRFVHTKLLSVLGKERRPREALKIFNEMREDGQIYPDMPAYHSIAVTLGQAGLVEELVHIIECMRQKPSKKLKNMNRKNWDPCFVPDIIIFNAVLNACIPSRQWKGVSWVLQQMRICGLRPTETTYGLAMEVMLKTRKYDHVHKFFEKMRERGLSPKALSYKVLVRAFWEEGNVDQAVATVRDMELRGVVGIPSVYYELACCLCNKGRWLDATMEVEKLKRLPHTKPMEITFTGMILASLDGGYSNECISIYEYMKEHCDPNIGTINAMLKVYGRSDMFPKAKELFESIKNMRSGAEEFGELKVLKSDSYTFASMLESSASACQWEFFEYVYKEMVFSGYKLDMCTHSWLLVQASKAGKWHLLEHGFDAALESGEMPHISLFTEMLCQLIIRRNTDRIIVLLNGMAHASVKISESQWTSLLQKNKDRLSLDALRGLLTQLHCSNLVTEQPIPDLLRSLEFLCGCTAPLASPQNILADNSTLREKKERAGDLCLTAKHCEQREEIPVDDYVLDQLCGDVGNNNISSMVPTAADILRSWKDERSKNGIFIF
ncbi:Pentatricopeptide repeat-containing protein [Platanthera zijinensis]|uniref:Pentatricopeptide repeat-containing protein n=1 Tax=Platanthera zijinensis TaxID=2320716 RepID=A0AAP0B7Z6_9ASPA